VSCQKAFSQRVGSRRAKNGWNERGDAVEIRPFLGLSDGYWTCEQETGRQTEEKSQKNYKKSHNITALGIK
jgi:hypothetical protein